MMCFVLQCRRKFCTRTLDTGLGSYKHFVGSLHLYDRDRADAEQYLGEGVQATVAMPSMPRGDPWPSIQKMLDAEFRIRRGEEIEADTWGVSAYWTDLIRLLQIFAARRNRPKV
jgi:thymidylate synthase